MPPQNIGELVILKAKQGGGVSECADYCKGEGQIALELMAALRGAPPGIFVAEEIRARMAAKTGLELFADTELPSEATVQVESDLELIDL